MNHPLPLGWGYAPQPRSEFERAREIEREVARRMGRQVSAMQRRDARMQAVASRKASMGGRDRQLHMRFALWAKTEAATTGRWPTARAVHETFGVSLNTAYAFLADFDAALNPKDTP